MGCRCALGVAVVAFAWLSARDATGAHAPSGPSSVSGNLLPNGDFRLGADQPAGWHLSGGEARWVDREFLEVTARGEGSHHWYTTDYRLEPGACYRFQTRARRVGGTGGSMISGPAEVNKDWQIGEVWTDFEYVFRTPDDTADDIPLRLGYWQGQGTFQFDSVSLVPVLPVNVLRPGPGGDLILGEGESLTGGHYRFQASFDWLGTNAHRPLQRATARFNSNRWVFADGNELIYHFGLPARKFRGAAVAWNVNYHKAGKCLVEVSTSEGQWVALGESTDVATGQAQLPIEMLPSQFLRLRIRGAGPNCSFQIDQIGLVAELDEAVADMTGTTDFATLHEDGSGLGIKRIHKVGDHPGGYRLQVEAANPTGSRQQLTLQASLLGPLGRVRALPELRSMVDDAQRLVMPIDVPLDDPGRHRLDMTLRTDAGHRAQAQLDLRLHELFRADYGYRVSDTDAAVVWWCDAPWKIARNRPAPASAPHGHQPVRLQAARGDAEAVQVIVHARQDVAGLTAAIHDFLGPGGAVIASSHVDISYVYYHHVQSPTDPSSIRGWWPDALPLLEQPLDVPHETNQPLWILVHVPREAQPGEYRAELKLSGDGFESQVPVVLKVWDFALPERNHLATGFGLSPGMIFRYHGLQNEADQRRVLDLYFQSFSRHRISPYDPVPLDPYRVQFTPDADPPRAEIDFSRFDPAMADALARYHFTHFRLPLEGMGGGTFHQRWEPSIRGFGTDSPEYQAMFSSYLGQLTDHLRQRSWLPMAYAYWFDEPDPKDYAFVREGMERLARHGAGLDRMLTEEPVEELQGAVDIWCPVTSHYDHAAADARRSKGDRFWWYVCTAPKAPYCTLFIDHPATELRVWLWQTWIHQVQGILVWQSNYWTSDAAFPDQAQNVYLDPMGYVSGYSTPKGTKRHWGNGDGRFIYPPLAAATPVTSDQPIIAPPVSSIRWEMLREGIEDYEMLYLLRELLSEKGAQLPSDTQRTYRQLLNVPETITRDLTTFTTDPRPILEHRGRVAEAIEHLHGL